MAWYDLLRPRVEAPSAAVAATVAAMDAHDPHRAYARAIGVRLALDSSFQSAMTALGVPGVDPGSTWTVVPRANLSYQTTETLYRQWPLARRLVDLLPASAASRTWRLDDDERRDVAGDLDARVGMRGVVRTWGSRARLYGGALALPYFEGQGADLSRPLAPNAPRGPVTAVQVFGGEELSVLLWDMDPGSPSFGMPLLVQITPYVPGAVVTATVHASRFVWLGSGMPLPPILRQTYPNATDLPVMEAYWTPLGHRWQVDGAAATIAPRIVEGVLSIPNLAAVNGADPTTAGGASTPSGFANAIAQGFARSASVVGVGVLDSAMQYQRHSASVSGFAEIDATTRREVAGVEGWPQRVIFGDEPGGLGNSGDGAMRQWSVIVDTYSQTHLGPAMMALYRLCLGPSLSRPRLAWEPLEKPSATEQAQIRLAHAQRDAALVAAGVLMPEEVRQRWTGTEYLDELTLDPGDGGEFAAAMLGVGPAPVGDPVIPADEPAPIAPVEAEAGSLQDTALNGAQVTSAVGIVSAVASGTLPRESGVAMLQRFFNLSQPDAEKIMGSVGRGFVPAEPVAADADDYAIPDAVAGNAAKALRWRDEHGDAVQGGTATGWRRAAQLAAGGRVSADVIVEMAAWWARHRGNAREPDAEYRDEPWRDAGYVAGLLWGGVSGDTWATEARRGIE